MWLISHRWIVLGCIIIKFKAHRGICLGWKVLYKSTHWRVQQEKSERKLDFDERNLCECLSLLARERTTEKERIWLIGFFFGETLFYELIGYCIVFNVVSFYWITHGLSTVKRRHFELKSPERKVFPTKSKNTDTAAISGMASSIWKVLGFSCMCIASVNPFNAFINVYWLPVSQFAWFFFRRSSKNRSATRQTQFFFITCLAISR